MHGRACERHTPKDGYPGSPTGMWQPLSGRMFAAIAREHRETWETPPTSTARQYFSTAPPHMSHTTTHVHIVSYDRPTSQTTTS